MPETSAWWERAEAGDPFAQLVLANAYLTGRHVPQSFENALRFLNAACANNFADAMLYHAMLATLGLARAQNLQEAYELTARAAALGSERAEAQLAVLSAPGGGIESWRAPIQATKMFRAPRIFTIKNFIPKPACDWLIAQTRPLQAPALVLDKVQGPITKSTRTNSSVTIDALETDIVTQLVNLRIAAAVGLSVAHQEPSNVLYYQPGQEYKPHYDFLTGVLLEQRAEQIAAIGQRVATLLIYLNDDYEGGETAFPRLGWRFKGRAGDALLFWNITPEGELDHGALHAGLPVTSGEKWLLSKWVRAKPIPLDSDYLWGDETAPGG